MAQKKREKRVSKGERPNVNQKLLNAIRRDASDSEKLVNAQTAFLAGKTDPWVTIANPNKEETAKRFIRVRYSHIIGKTAKELKASRYIMKSMASE